MKKKRFKSNPLFSTSTNNISVDVENGIIKGVVIVQGGIDKESGYFNDTFLKDLVKEANAQTQGVKSRFGHPNMCSTTLGTFIGRYKNFSLIKDVKNKVIADLHLDPITKKTQVEGRGVAMWDYLLEMAANNPDMFGNSIHFIASTEDETIEGKEVEVYELRSLLASDLVDTPAATDNLFKSNSDFGVVATQFLDENPAIFELLQKDTSIIEDFFKRYEKYLKKVKNMKKKKRNGILENIKKTFEKTKDIDVTLADGRIIKVATENENAQVGDTVTDSEGNKLADGDYLLADDSTFVVVDGKISEIKEPEQSTESTQEQETAIKELSQAVELLAEKIVAIDKNYKTLARSIKSKDYEVPPAEDTNNKPKEDLYTRVKSKLNEKNEK